MERVDVVVVGARLAGCAVAAPLARAGRRVLVLDRMRFPSDQLSTHVLMPAGTSELAKLGALPRILALNPSRVRWAHIEVGGDQRAASGCARRRDGIDYGVCVPRDLQDVQLVEAAREQGAEVRERCTVRVAALARRARRRACATATREGARARGRLRRSSSAPTGGARRSPRWSARGRPYRLSRNGRGLVFRYLEDPLAGTVDAETYYQWREGDSFAFAFPTTPAGRLLILLMGHRDEAERGARATPRATGSASSASIPASPRAWPARRPDRSCARPARRPPSSAPPRAPGGRWRATPGTSRTRSPARACATRCSPGARSPSRSCRCSTTPPRSTAPPARWEADRDRECLPAYHFANSDTRIERQSPVLCELVRDAGRTTRARTSATCSAARARRSRSRPRRGSRAPSGPRCGAASARALERCAARSRTCARSSRSAVERRADRFRSTRLIAGSEHPGASWPPEPAPCARRDPAAEAGERSSAAGADATQPDRRRTPSSEVSHDAHRRRAARARARGGRAQPRAHRGSDPRRPPRARRRGDRRPRGVHHAERVREGAARHARGRWTASRCSCSRAWRASSTACSPAASSPCAAAHLRHLRARRARRRRAPARQGHPHRLGAALLRRRRRRRAWPSAARSAARSG